MTIEYTSQAYPPQAPRQIEDPFGGDPVWLVTRHDDVSAVLADRRLVMNPRTGPGGTDYYTHMLTTLGIAREYAPCVAGNMVHTDPPDHTRLRKLVIRAFSARRIAALRPRVEAIAKELSSALPARAESGTVDLIEHFSYPLPITVICELLGVPEEHRDQWHAWSQDCTSMDPRRMNPMLADISEHIRELAGLRRAEPRDDLLTGLVQAREQGADRLSDNELIAMVLALMVGGHDTTAHLIGNGVVALLTHPGQLAMLREDPSLLPGAVQELLRWCGPAGIAMPRFATEDLTIGGAGIRAGERVQALLSTANRDPLHYDRPEVLDITRRPADTGGSHLSFSHGAHYCLGASLAGQEGEVALEVLLRQYPDLALAVPEDDLEWKPLPFTRQLVRLPVWLGAAR
ncbi:cytochrome P450 family protein [Streptomyces boncukensis]|uniref:Cytochrome P450 n=1 Tax=Streptomyces boncukensis TaxID=2711219 RepID=A0A6G4X7G4_9ACTN|nr:cytochrome P450 [Streptomyces boncukensis]NGO72790.1 cytochrome P450 [Streptomyces boncukensis]